MWFSIRLHFYSPNFISTFVSPISFMYLIVLSGSSLWPLSERISERFFIGGHTHHRKVIVTKKLDAGLNAQVAWATYSPIWLGRSGLRLIFSIAFWSTIQASPSCDFFKNCGTNIGQNWGPFQRVWSLYFTFEHSNE